MQLTVRAAGPDAAESHSLSAAPGCRPHVRAGCRRGDQVKHLRQASFPLRGLPEVIIKKALLKRRITIRLNH